MPDIDDLFVMSESMFDNVCVWLTTTAEYNTVTYGISIPEINRFIVPELGIEMEAWTDRLFRMHDPQKYLVFILNS